MNKLIAIATVAMALAMGAANAETSKGFVPYSDALAKCSAEWKQSETRRNTPKGKGVEAWNNFRRECVTEKGYVKGAKRPQS